MTGSSRDHAPSITAVTSGQSLTPGQHLHAMFVAHFSGGGWADAPLWDDFDEAGHARWEVNAEAIARNIRVALAAPAMLEALKRNRAALDLIDPMRPLQYATTMDLMRKDMSAAIAKATTPSSAKPDLGDSSRDEPIPPIAAATGEAP